MFSVLTRYKIIVQYDGSFFSGWQLQKNKKTVQGEIENSLRIIILNQQLVGRISGGH